jgi:AcrR family transcriptional regulator
MQRPDERKRRDIIGAAAKLFATRPFHEVRLEDVAAAAHVGKGTVYIYFENKDELYASLRREGFAAVVDRLNQQINGDDGQSAWDVLRTIVKELVSFAKGHPYFFQLMRDGLHPQRDQAIVEKRGELARLIERTIRRGIRRGEMCDPHPQLTAQFIPSLVRSAMVFGPSDLSAEVITTHIVRILGGGIGRKDA